MNSVFDYQLNERHIEQQLVARSLSGLFDWLLTLKGLTLQQLYTLRWLYAVGGQSILYLAEGTDGRLAIAKMALLSYHRAAYVGTENIFQARQRLEAEAAHLRRFQGSILPTYYDLIYAPNPLLSPARGEKITQREPFLLMELLAGQTLEQVAHALHVTHQAPYALLEWIAWQVLSAATDFSLAISQDEQPYLYADFTASNIFLTQDKQKPVRILDAGSLIPFHADSAQRPPFTWDYTPPDYYEAYDRGQDLWPTPAYVMYALGKVLWHTLTDQQLVPGKDPDLSTPVLQQYSPALRALVAQLIQRTYVSFEQLKQAIQPDFPLESQSLPDLAELSHALHEALQTNAQREKEIPATPNVKSPKTETRLTKMQTAQTDAVQVLRYSPDGRLLAVAGGRKVELWNASTLQKEKKYTSIQAGQVMSLDFDSTGQYLAAGAVQGDMATLLLWQTSLADAIWQHQGKGYNGNLALNAQGDLLAAASKWRVGVFHPQQALLEEQDYEGLAEQGVYCAFARQKPLLAVGGFRGTRLWNVHTHEALAPDLRTEAGAFVEKLAFGDNDSLLATASLNLHGQTILRYNITIWDLSAVHTILWQIEVPVARISDMRLAGNGRLLFVSSPDGHVWIWDIAQKRELIHLDQCGPVSSLDFAARQRTLVTATASGEICLYRLEEA